MQIEINADWDEGETLQVEDFENWVWVYGVEEEARYVNGIRESRVYYTGSNIYSNNDREYWLEQFKINSKTYDTHLLWKKGYGNSPYISTTKLIWNWYAYDYTPETGHENPSATTRYYDGSG